MICVNAARGWSASRHLLVAATTSILRGKSFSEWLTRDGIPSRSFLATSDSERAMIGMVEGHGGFVSITIPYTTSRDLSSSYEDDGGGDHPTSDTYLGRPRDVQLFYGGATRTRNSPNYYIREALAASVNASNAPPSTVLVSTSEPRWPPCNWTELRRTPHAVCRGHFAEEELTPRAELLLAPREGRREESNPSHRQP